MPQIATRAARALPRYTDIIVADVGKFLSASKQYDWFEIISGPGLVCTHYIPIVLLYQDSQIFVRSFLSYVHSK